MEYGLWRMDYAPAESVSGVLILVLMEYGLWLVRYPARILSLNVLILVLMEYGLWPKTWIIWINTR